MRVETDFNSHETGFNSHESVISTRTSVRATNTRPTHNTKKEPPYPPKHETSPPLRITDGRGKALARVDRLNKTARSPAAQQITQTFSASLSAPLEAGVLADIAIQVDNCLSAGIGPDAIAAGLNAWTDSDSWAPSQIPRFVHKTANRAGKATTKALGYRQAGAELIAEMENRPCP
jgi:hypothetical protein